MGPVDSPEILTASLRCLSEPAVWTHDSTRVRESVSLAYRLFFFLNICSKIRKGVEGFSKADQELHIL